MKIKNKISEVFFDILDSLHLDTSADFDPHENLEKVITAINGSVDKVFPLQKRSKKQLKKFKNPWLTQGILNSIKQCHYLHYIAYFFKKDDDAIKKYKTYKLQLVRSIEKAKELEKQNNFQRCSGDSTKTWRALNEFFNKNTNHNTNITINDENGVIQSDPKKVANILNSHFVQKRIKLASDLPNSHTSVYQCLGPRLEKNIPNHPFNDEEVLKCIYDLKPKNEAKVLKWLAEKLVPILKHIFNRFLDIGRYPNTCKIGKVTALHKGGDKHDQDNFRPITILSQMNHIFEKILKDRLLTFLTDIKFITDFQFGFVRITQHLMGFHI